MPVYTYPAVTVLSDQTLGSAAAAVTFSAISGGYRELEIIWNARGDTAAVTAGVNVTFNNDTGSNYQRVRLTGASNTVVAGPVTGAATTNYQASFVPAASATASYSGSGKLRVLSYANTTFFKNAICESAFWDNTNYNTWMSTGFWLSAVAITRVDLTASAGNFITGSRFTLLGLM